MIPTDIDPGLRILTRLEAANLLGMSVLCLDRLGNDGPKRIRLSARRVGYRVAHLQDWMDSRTETSTRRGAHLPSNAHAAHAAP